MDYYKKFRLYPKKPYFTLISLIILTKPKFFRLTQKQICDIIIFDRSHCLKSKRTQINEEAI